jgi:hypothetical protein
MGDKDNINICYEIFIVIYAITATYSSCKMSVGRVGFVTSFHYLNELWELYNALAFL